MAAKLTARGLPAKAIGNAGQGGADRRGVDEPNRRPASVKVGSRRSRLDMCRSSNCNPMKVLYIFCGRWNRGSPDHYRS